VLSPKPVSHLIGRVSWNIFEALGLRVLVIEDTAALAKAQRSSAWRTLRQPQVMPVTAYPPPAA